MAGDNTVDPLGELELLWRAPERPKRGPKPSLSLERIVRTAIEIADTEGIDALSMQRLAEEFGFTTMSLYRYVRRKEQLLALMTDRASGEPPELAGPDAHWRVDVERLVRGLWEVFHQHPWMHRVRFSSPPIGPHQLAWMDRGIGVFTRSGLDHQQAFSAFMFVHSAVWRWAQLQIDEEEAARATGVSPAESDRAFGRALAKYADPETYPSLTVLTAEGTWESDGSQVSKAEADWEFAVAFGLNRLLDGIEAYVAAQLRDDA